MLAQTPEPTFPMSTMSISRGNRRRCYDYVLTESWEVTIIDPINHVARDFFLKGGMIKFLKYWSREILKDMSAAVMIDGENVTQKLKKIPTRQHKMLK